MYIELKEDELDEHQTSKHNVLSSFWQKMSDVSETKKYAILLTLVLLINTIVIIIIANNKASNKINELSIKNEDNLYENESFDLSYEPSTSDYLSDIIDDPPLIELDDLVVKPSYVNSQQNNDTPSESADKTVVIPDENNQAKDDY